MSKAEIAAWASTAGTDFDDEDKPVLERSEIDAGEDDWSAFMLLAKRVALASRTKDRIAFWKDKGVILGTRGDLSETQVDDVLDLLIQTYPRYIDQGSREAALAVLDAFLRRDETSAETTHHVRDYLLEWLRKEIRHVGTVSSTAAASNRFVLLTWCSTMYTVLLDTTTDFPKTSTWPLVLHLLATLLNAILDEESHGKHTLRQGAVIHLRRAIRKSRAIPEVLETLLDISKKSPNAVEYASFLGLTIDVAIRLKPMKVRPDIGPSSVQNVKDALLSYYLDNLLGVKTQVPKHSQTAFHDFIKEFVSADDFVKVVVPTVEQALSKGSLVAVRGTALFLQSYTHEVQVDVSARLQVPILGCVKSSDPSTRTAAGELYVALAKRLPDAKATSQAAGEVLALLKAGKTTGPDHRIALYAILAKVGPSSELSPGVVSTSLPLLVKETNDGVIASIESAIVVHLSYMAQQGVPLPTDVASLLAKEMTTLKTNVRRSLSNIIGSVFWLPKDGNPPSDPSVTFLQAFAKTVSTGLQAYLKTVATTPLAPPAGPREAYIAAAVILRWSQLASFQDLCAKNAAILAIPMPSAKPSFLLWDKVYHKLTDVSDERWLARALEGVFSHFEKDLQASEPLRRVPCIAVGLITTNTSSRLLVGPIYFHIVQSGNLESRKDVLDSLRLLSRQNPSLLHEVIRDSAAPYLRAQGKDSKDTNKSRFGSILLAISSFPEAVPKDVRVAVLKPWVVVAHHPAASTNPRQAWIEMIQQAQLDPLALVTENLDYILELVQTASSQDGELAKAAYTAATTITFIAPSVVVDRLVTQIKEDLRLDRLKGIGSEEFSIWKTPKGTLFIDVLAAKKEAAATSASTPRSGKKNQSIEEWEEDLRRTLEAKKAQKAGTKLTKDEQALVSSQLAKESEIRNRVSLAQRHLLHGLALVRSLVAADVEEFRNYIATLASLLLDAYRSQAINLVGPRAFETYLDLGSGCSPRLEGFNKWIGIATLRAFEVPIVPLEMQEEPLDNLVQRVLYRLQSLSETSPFDPATYSYLSSFVNHVIRNGGVGVTETEAVAEQVALALKIIGAHCGECHDVSYPRQDMASGLIFAIGRYSILSKEAASSLITLGQTIYENATVPDMQVFIQGTMADEVYVRNACLQAMQPFDMTDIDWSPELWIARQDDDSQNARLAAQLWEENGFDIPETFVDDLIAFLSHKHQSVRKSTPLAFAEAVETFPAKCGLVLRKLRGVWKEKAQDMAPKFDEFGILIDDSLRKSDDWQSRVAIARTYECLAPHFPVEDVVHFFNFLITDKALGDSNNDVRRAILEAGIAVIDEKAAKCLQGLITAFEAYLKKGSSADDKVKEAVIILLGRAAKHLGKGDARIKTVVDRLVSALRTPSEVVQTAVADCLPPLVTRIKGEMPKLVNRLFSELVEAGKYGERRGAAYGLAGVVKGLGLASLQKFDILGKISAYIDEKKYFETRQGALFAIETLSATLGRLFEPYAIELLPLLLSAFGDTSSDVREATEDACKVIMANMSGYGVKMILPKLLEGLDDKQWRSKKGSIELLGTMAFCAPKQLALSLPTVVPRLTEVLKDSHAQVRQSGSKSLKQFSEVISNPEIRDLVPILQKALVDPDRTPDGLKALLDTTFVHYVDNASLAIVVPILENGLKIRGADSKRMAVQIVGNLASLTDAKDFTPHLGVLMPLVHNVLVDPVPDVRGAAAKSLGTLVERLGEPTFPDLVPGLLQTLRSETSASDRQGAAQGLSEVLSGLGMDRMEGLLPQIIDNARSPRPFVREGYMSLLVYLPITFGQRFAPYLARIVQPILDGLSDVEELVRSTSMKAGRIMINNYSSKATDLLLPQLQKGMFDESPRIRLSSLTLVGELLYKLAGISGKVTTDEEEEVNVNAGEPTRRVLADVLGKERRDRVLAVLFIARQDGVSSVRLASSHIWKALVNNTPRTIRDILPSLVEEIIDLLVTAGSDQQETAASTMSELCRKFGEKMLGDIIGILRTSSQSQDAQTREGACLAISEVVENTTEETMEDYETQIIGVVRSSLVDESPKVRAAAAAAFDALQKHIGTKAIDQTIPTLLGALRQAGPGSETALRALKEVMTVRASSVFPVLIPTLITTPMTAFNARALSQLVVVAGDALAKRLNQILQSLVVSMETEKDEEVLEAVEEASHNLLESIADDEGLDSLMTILLDWSKDNSPPRRVSGLKLFAVFCEVTEMDFTDYRVDWVRRLVILLDDPTSEVVEASIAALDAFVKAIDKEDLEGLVIALRRTIEITGAPGRSVPGFSTKGLASIVPIILAGLTGGSSDQREQAAYAISDLVEKTEEAAIKPFTTQLTGPLIRVITQATTLPPAVKSAILAALTTMLDTIPTFVKPFFPQLQRTFCKSLVDPASQGVRTRAATALGSLFKSQPRVDPLITELAGNIRSSEDPAVTASVYLALSNVVKSSQTNLGAASRQLLAELIEEAFSMPPEDSFTLAVAQLFTALTFDVEVVRDVVMNHLVVGHAPNALTSRILAEATANSPKVFYDLRCVLPMVKQVVASIGSDESAVSRPAREAKETIKTQPPFAGDSAVQAIF